MEENKTYQKGSFGWLREQAKKDGFDNLADWNKWKREKLPKRKFEFDKRSDYEDDLAKRRGFKDRFEMYNKGYEDNKWKIRCRELENRWNKGVCSPQWENEDCPNWLGNEIGEMAIGKYAIPILIGDIQQEMPHGNHGFDFLVVGGIRVDVKVRCLQRQGRAWNYVIDYNNIADIFLLVGIDDRESLNILHVWIFHRNDIIRKHEFWRRYGFWITNTSYKLEEFEKYDVTHKLPKLKEISEEL